VSPLGQALADYLRVRRALGFKLDRAERLLAQFVAYLHDHGAEVPTIEDALAWATSPTDATPRWWAHRLSTMRGFAVHLHALDPRVEVPPPGLRRGPRRAIPYLYSAADIGALVDAAAMLARPLGAATYQTLIGLLAVTGMRVGEAIRLDRDDLDADHDGPLRVRDSKFGKSRLVPPHPSTVTALRDYLHVRDRLLPGAGQPGVAHLHRGHPARPATTISTRGGDRPDRHHRRVASQRSPRPEPFTPLLRRHPRTRAKQRVRSVQQRLKPDDDHAEDAVDHTAKQHRRPGSSVPAARFDGPPDKLRHAGPQRKTHRHPLIEQAKHAQQQEEDGQGRGGNHRQLPGHDGGNHLQVEPGLAEFMVQNVGVHVRKPKDRQGGGGSGQDEPWGLVPSGGRDHRGGDDRAVDRAAEARGEHAQPARPGRACRRGASHAARLRSRAMGVTRRRRYATFVLPGGSLLPM
jgi:integrase